MQILQVSILIQKNITMYIILDMLQQLVQLITQEAEKLQTIHIHKQMFKADLQLTLYITQRASHMLQTQKHTILILYITQEQVLKSHIHMIQQLLIHQVVIHIMSNFMAMLKLKIKRQMLTRHITQEVEILSHIHLMLLKEN